MTPADDRRVLAVLCADGGDRPPLLAPVQERVDVRWTDPAGLGEAVAGADALLLWDFFSTAVSGVWHRADRLEWIHVAAAGVDKLLFPGLVDSDVTVTNARGVFDRPIAEYVLGMCLAHAKRLPAMLSDQGARTWRHRDTDSLTGQPRAGRRHGCHRPGDRPPAEGRGRRRPRRGSHRAGPETPTSGTCSPARTCRRTSATSTTSSW